eukprot:4009797-Amphidinium_carterae.1
MLWSYLSLSIYFEQQHHSVFPYLIKCIDTRVYVAVTSRIAAPLAPQGFVFLGEQQQCTQVRIHCSVKRMGRNIPSVNLFGFACAPKSLVTYQNIPLQNMNVTSPRIQSDSKHVITKEPLTVSLYHSDAHRIT